jgi:zinc protease
MVAALLATLLVKLGYSQEGLSQPVPLEQEVRTGVLDNGLTYYIRHNKEPKERASFYIIQNVGALLENDDQNGLAHFLEHMAFNGTGNFEGKGVLNTLERHGVAFGRNINAYTAFNETVYNLSDVPVAPEGLIDTCLLILHDWANNLSLLEDEIDLERGVIKEEWRTRRTANFRLREQWFPVVFEGSMWAERDIIGDTTVIVYHDPETLRDFYHDWYRTDLQAIAVVGDFDVDEVEDKVIELFSQIPAVEGAAERPIFKIPHREETAFVVATDDEATQSQINIYIAHENKDGQDKTLADLRDSYINSLYSQMSGQRIQELLQKGTPPFVMGSTSYGGFVRGYNAYSISVVANPNKQPEALEAIMVETERIKRFGFTESELERAKSNLLTSLENRYNERDKIRNDQFARQFAQHYLTKDVVPGIEFQYEFAQAILPTITADEIHAKACEWIIDDNRSIVITGPSDAEHLSEDQAKGIISKVESMEIEPYQDTETASSLIEEELIGAEIIATKELDEFDAVEWTLTNNVKVVYRFADYEKDNVALSAYSWGGSSLWDNEYVPSAEMMQTFVSSYGVGEFDAIALQRMLTGKKVSLSPWLSSVSEGFSGSSTPRDFETLMQLTYLYFENPRFDQEAHDALMSRYMSFVSNMEKDPQKIMQDSLTYILSDYHPRVRVLNTKMLEDINFEHIEKIYTDRFKDASDFTFFIVGNVDEDTAKGLAQKYLGSLTPLDRSENWVDREVRSPEGKTQKMIPLPLTTPKANVNVRYVNRLEYDRQNILELRVLEGILRLRYTETIREDEGGTYGVRVGSNISQYPLAEAQVIMNFDCDPGRADHLKSIIYREIDKIVENGPTSDDFGKTISNLLKDREQSRQHNSFWLNSLYGYYTSGINMSGEEYYEDILKDMTKDDIKAFASNFFVGADLIDIVFVPEGE